MILIAILLVLAIEHFVGAVDHLRRFDWFRAYWLWCEKRLSQHSVWQGPLGVVTIILPPLLLLGLISFALYHVTPVLDFILACIVLLYCLGPADLGHQVDRYTNALIAGNASAAAEARAGFINHRWDKHGQLGGTLASMLEKANSRLFAILFWFAILGPVGAFLYRLTAELYRHYHEVHGGFADSVRDLYNLLNWPTTRLSALGFALAGNLVDALEGWQRAEASTLTVNEEVLIESGLSALQFRQHYEAGASGAADSETVIDSDNDQPHTDEVVSWVRAARDLENRTLIVWLSVLAVMTIAGVVI